MEESSNSSAYVNVYFQLLFSLLTQNDSSCQIKHIWINECQVYCCIYFNYTNVCVSDTILKEKQTTFLYAFPVEDNKYNI